MSARDPGAGGDAGRGRHAPPRRVGIVCRPEVPERLKVARQVVERLRGAVDLVAQPGLADALELPAARLDAMEADVVVPVGGDGTILYTLHNTRAPVMGVNMGEMGFLTAAEPEHLATALDRLLAGDFNVEDRTRIAVRLGDDRLPDATNEVVVKTPRPSKILSFSIANRARETVGFRSDGVIVATPTGSTAYALSAGGPLVDPRLHAMLVVPLAAFSISARPLVLPANEELTLRLTEDGKDGVLAVDGQYEREVTPNDALTLSPSEHPARFVRFDDDFFGRLTGRLLQP